MGNTDQSCCFFLFVLDSCDFVIFSILADICTELHVLDLSNVAVTNQNLKEIGLKCSHLEVSLCSMLCVQGRTQ